MLGSLAGAESLEILVMLKDLSEQGFRKLEGNIKGAEATANRANFSGFSKKTKGLAADAEHAAGKGGRGGLGALLSGFTGLPGPIAAAGLAIGAFSALSAATIPVYEKVEQQEKALETAFRKHGTSLDVLRPKIAQAIKDGEQYAYNAGDTREAILKLALAGHKWSDIQAALPRIMDLARAKHLDLAEAARMYELALMGNQRALKDLGIIMPAVSKKVLSAKDATLAAKIADEEYTIALHHLHQLQQAHAVTTKKVTETVNAHGVVTQHVTTLTKGHAASVDKLTAAEIRVQKASEKSKKAHQDLATAQGKGAAAAARLTLLNQKLDGSVGDQRDSVTSLQRGQAKLNDAWERFATKIGPALTTAIGTLVDAMAGLVDQLSAFLGQLPQLPDWLTKPFHPGVNGPYGSTTYKGKGANYNAPPPPRGPGNVGHPPPPGGGSGGGRKRRAAGGWIGLHGAEWFYGGEKGPEWVVSNDKLHAPGGGKGHGHDIYLDGVKVGKALDHAAYWQGLAATGSGNRG